MKVRNKRRLLPSMRYWRDQSGLELDLLLDAAAWLTPVEFKAGQTVVDDWLRALNADQALRARRGASGPRLQAPLLVHGGEAPRTCADVSIHPWRRWPAQALRQLALAEPGTAGAPAQLG